MSSLLALHAIAAERGEGLHPDLLEALRRQEASRACELAATPSQAVEASRWEVLTQGLGMPMRQAVQPQLE
ncbi:hypothetical protein EV286_10480 [Rhizobium sp. BK251]|nr:hypothetical protein EV286_10480 [Rhizobium sp. BK251]